MTLFATRIERSMHLLNKAISEVSPPISIPPDHLASSALLLDFYITKLKSLKRDAERHDDLLAIKSELLAFAKLLDRVEKMLAQSTLLEEAIYYADLHRYVFQQSSLRRMPLDRSVFDVGKPTGHQSDNDFDLDFRTDEHELLGSLQGAIFHVRWAIDHYLTALSKFGASNLDEQRAETLDIDAIASESAHGAILEQELARRALLSYFPFKLRNRGPSGVPPDTEEMCVAETVITICMIVFAEPFSYTTITDASPSRTRSDVTDKSDTIRFSGKKIALACALVSALDLADLFGPGPLANSICDTWINLKRKRRKYNV